MQELIAFNVGIRVKCCYWKSIRGVLSVNLKIQLWAECFGSFGLKKVISITIRCVNAAGLLILRAYVFFVSLLRDYCTNYEYISMFFLVDRLKLFKLSFINFIKIHKLISRFMKNIQKLYSYFWLIFSPGQLRWKYYADWIGATEVR